jgi:hypothetical protein
MARRTPSGFDDILVAGIGKNLLPLLAVGALCVSLFGLTLNASLERIIQNCTWTAGRLGIEFAFPTRTIHIAETSTRIDAEEKPLTNDLPE